MLENMIGKVNVDDTVVFVDGRQGRFVVDLIRPCGVLCEVHNLENGTKLLCRRDELCNWFWFTAHQAVKKHQQESRPDVVGG